MRQFDMPTASPLVYRLDAETLEPLGAPHDVGARGECLIRGRFLSAPTLPALRLEAIEGLLAARRTTLYEIIPHLKDVVQSTLLAVSQDNHRAATGAFDAAVEFGLAATASAATSSAATSSTSSSEAMAMTTTIAPPPPRSSAEEALPAELLAGAVSSLFVGRPWASGAFAIDCAHCRAAARAFVASKASELGSNGGGGGGYQHATSTALNGSSEVFDGVRPSVANPSKPCPRLLCLSCVRDSMQQPVERHTRKKEPPAAPPPPPPPPPDRAPCASHPSHHTTAE